MKVSILILVVLIICLIVILLSKNNNTFDNNPHKLKVNETVDPGNGYISQTPYNVTMRDCSSMCNNPMLLKDMTLSGSDCLMDCHISALHNQGITDTYPPYANDINPITRKLSLI